MIEQHTDKEIDALINVMVGDVSNRQVDLTNRRRALLAEAMAFYRQKRPLMPRLDTLDFRINLRHTRASQMTGYVMSIIHSCLDGRGRLQAGEAAQKIMDAFFTAGVEVVTDADRAAAGLPPRDSAGWTQQELAALEAKKLEVMLRPMPVNLG